MKYNIRSALWLSLIIFIVFLLQAVFKGLTDYFILDTRTVLFEFYTLITAIFLHSGVPHLLYNLFALALFGTILEHVIGSRKFLILFFVSGLAASLVSLPFYTRVLGASGAVFGILGMLGILRPKMTVWLYSMPMPMIVALFVWAAGDVLGIFAPSGTANIAHLGGLFIGVSAGFYYRKRFREKREKKEDVHIDEDKVKEWEKSF
jgi:membrane associated rhomboid family serine protease|tara:strand:- start:401 stop:1015 length:615 start_codon:yes stop_codon:yes gene_type:complete